jgi:RNA-binding protein
MIKLSPPQRQHLKGLAHPKQPVVMIGDKGLTESVLKEIDRALLAHELIKIKAASDERSIREAWLNEICTALSASPVQQIGKVLVIYRPAEKAVITLPG